MKENFVDTDGVLAGVFAAVVLAAFVLIPPVVECLTALLVVGGEEGTEGEGLWDGVGGLKLGDWRR